MYFISDKDPFLVILSLVSNLECPLSRPPALTLLGGTGFSRWVLVEGS